MCIKNNGYTAKEVVEYLLNEGEDYFKQTRVFNKYLMDRYIIKKENDIYCPMPEYKDLFIIDKYKRGKIKGIKFNNNFMDWIKERLKEIKHPEKFMHNRPYLETIKAFVEGERNIKEWYLWWQENDLLIARNEGDYYHKISWIKRYRKFKEWQLEICGDLNEFPLQNPPSLSGWLWVSIEMLEHYQIEFQRDTAINWSSCYKCGEPLFHAIPEETTIEDIVDFARNSNLEDKEIIERCGWMHPGSYCPNGCHVVTGHY